MEPTGTDRGLPVTATPGPACRDGQTARGSETPARWPVPPPAERPGVSPAPPGPGDHQAVRQEERCEQAEGEELRRPDARRRDRETHGAKREAAPPRRPRQATLQQPEQRPPEQSGHGPRKDDG